MAVNKSNLIERIYERQPHLTPKDVEIAVKTIVDTMSETLASGGRIEIRGFGSFSLNYRAPRVGRNPRTGESVDLAGRYVPHFKPGKKLRESVEQSRLDHPEEAAGEGRISRSEERRVGKECSTWGWWREWRAR